MGLLFRPFYLGNRERARIQDSQQIESYNMLKAVLTPTPSIELSVRKIWGTLRMQCTTKHKYNDCKDGDDVSMRPSAQKKA